jgi:hypothetical protein
MQLIVDQRDKAVFLIERSRVLVSGLHFQSVDPNIVRQSRAPVERVEQ